MSVLICCLLLHLPTSWKTSFWNLCSQFCGKLSIKKRFECLFAMFKLLNLSSKQFFFRIMLRKQFFPLFTRRILHKTNQDEIRENKLLRHNAGRHSTRARVWREGNLLQRGDITYDCDDFYSINLFCLTIVTNLKFSRSAFYPFFFCKNRSKIEPHIYICRSCCFRKPLCSCKSTIVFHFSLHHWIFKTSESDLSSAATTLSDSFGRTWRLDRHEKNVSCLKKRTHEDGFAPIKFRAVRITK